VGHRVVHGGRRFTEPVVVDDDVVSALRTLSPLAPLHNPANVEGIVRAQAAFPGIPHVAVFDTGFHRTLPPEAYTYAVPRSWRDEHHVRRYGFHGSSYAWVSRRTAALLGREVEDVRMVVLHLGNGASACAVDGGRSVETSMGLSPAEGLVMGTRSGDVDPALAGYLARVAGMSAEDFDRSLNRESGLLGLSGVSDFRALEERRAAGDAEAALAFDVTVHRIRKYVGAYAAVLGRLDALAFTGGIGERSPVVRAAVVDGLGVLGLELDVVANAEGPAERLVSSGASSTPVWVVPTDEEREIGRATLSVVGVANAL
jgi:acetate kinase